MGAVPGFCVVNHRGSMARKLLGQPPMVLRTVPSLLQYCLDWHPSETELDSISKPIA